MASLGYTDFPGLKQDGSDTDQQQANVVNNMLLGKINATLEITLAVGAATTTVDDSRIYEKSALVFCAKTSNAAAAPMTFYTAVKGEATLHHASNANTDRTGVLLIIG